MPFHPIQTQNNIQVSLSNITSGAVKTRIIAPCNGKLSGITISPDAALTTGPTTLTVKIGSTTVMAIAIATTLLADQTITHQISSNNDVIENQIVSISSDGAGTGTVNLAIRALFDAVL